MEVSQVAWHVVESVTRSRCSHKSSGHRFSTEPNGASLTRCVINGLHQDDICAHLYAESMYHTFAASEAAAAGAEADRGGRRKDTPRTSTAVACVRCRQRKIRCDGAQPCEPCHWRGSPRGCVYPTPARRSFPSKQYVSTLWNSSWDHRLMDRQDWWTNSNPSSNNTNV